jgi:hypothetical protein
MKSALPFFALLLVFASCTTAYKSGQTPDDVYYSPARPQAEYVTTNDKQDQYRYDEQAEDDRYLRMKVHNRRTWSDLDYYYSDPYAYSYRYRNRFNNYGNIYYNTPWDYYSSWNYYYNPYAPYYRPHYYNPYGPKVIVINPRQPVYNRPRTFNLNVYNPPATNGYDSKNTSRRVYRGDNGSYNYDRNNSSYNSGNDKGNGLRNIFNSNNSNNASSNVPSRSERSNSSSSSSSSTPSRSSTNAPVRKF